MSDLITTVGTGNNQSVTMFNFREHDVRVCQDANGEPWFVAKDVADILGYENNRTMSRRLDEDEKGVQKLHTLGGEQEMTIINESGLYNAIMGSNKPESKTFKKWVTSEVLPAIRKNGSYVASSGTETLEELTLRAMQGLQAAVERQKVQLAEQRKQLELQAPDVEYCQEVLSASNLHTANSIAQQLKISAIRLNQFLLDENWIYKQGGIYYTSSKIRSKGYAGYHVIPYMSHSGETKTREHLKWTEQGRRAVIELWNKKHQIAG